ncbi:MAG: patatin-like phospholipase family protein [Acidobacteria bacterium]|nr:patatin-like phospholipase family protein [Acidobacteriota bacterium]
MQKNFYKLSSLRIGLALSGGSVRGLAHIGVIKALTEVGLKPSVVTGTSVGSLVGAAIASGMEWYEIAEMASSIFWPSLLNGVMLESFCEKHLPENFSHLKLPFAAIATELPNKKAIAITKGKLSSAVSASCAIRFLRRPVVREGQKLKDGGMVCVLPSLACRDLGADFVIASDVWELSSVLRRAGFKAASPLSGRFYPLHYRLALERTNLLIQPPIPAIGYLPGNAAIKRMIAIGEESTHQALSYLIK